MALWKVLAACAILLGFAVLGVATATNYGGVMEEHARRSATTSAWLQRIPPWSWRPVPEDRVVRSGLVAGRLIGVLFTTGSLAALIAIVVHGIAG